MFQNTLFAEVGGTVAKIVAPVGSHVNAFDEVLVLESMKMEFSVGAPSSGTVLEVLVTEGDVIAEGQALAVMECPE
ncbi:MULTISPECIES: acetyl-CoA carboxylase biotin carboxyl carrier protein subunit [Delftia]|uniref:Biotin/lipoyl-binding protein n=2 Tax=Delftia TaxID=80865 RepID=A0A7T2RZB0_DELAC|nr:MULTISPECIES: acetyl-CoA carboxylase biotin carboxyl carrier protein subunit [Delftia]MBB1651203.1 hypothetical protein [Delftia sp. UME58]MBL8357400.1 biotin/lipoyl-binding protein [Delftia acidovorans]QPS05963.1 biotin/lipoyl-binding protein [Delftia acidovorans]